MQFTELKPGKSVENSDIEVFKSEEKSDRFVYLIAGVHGDEVEGVYVLHQLFDYLEADEDIALPVIIIPVLNIDGYRSSSRLNSHGVDLNRNLPSSNWKKDFSNKFNNPGESPLSEPENIFLDKLMEKYPPYIVISLHSWKPHISYSGNCQEVAQILSSYNNYPISKEKNREFPGGLEFYVPEKFKAPVLSLVMPKIKIDLSLKEVWDANKEGLKELMKNGQLDPKNNLLTLED